ncbi:MAG TPA: methyltransferase domain-containing protein [Solirubrobacter sp.]|nr:methyltransferase domain-containing protein [Solirubrobacter sp.]
MAPADFPAGFFDRAQTGPRGAWRLDAAAVAALRDLYSDLGIDGRVLDLCGSSAEHFDVPPDELVALDGDPDDTLPYGDAEFDDVLCAGGVGGLTRPLEAFAEVARILRPGGRFVCTLGGPDPAAIRGWTQTDDAGRVRIMRAYFSRTPGFSPAESDLRTSLTGAGDRLWAVWATRAARAG